MVIWCKWSSGPHYYRFSQWSFDVKHIKGKDNILAYFFSKPPAPPLKMISLIIPCLYPLERVENLSANVREILFIKLLHKRSIENFKKFLEITIFRNGLVFRGLKFHPDVLSFPYSIPYSWFILFTKRSSMFLMIFVWGIHCWVYLKCSTIDRLPQHH